MQDERQRNAMIQALAPGILIAAPTLVDSFFENSVILLLEADEDGAMGLMVNQPLKLTLGELSEVMSLSLLPCYQSKPVYGGGPVTPEHGWILAKRNQDTPKELEIAFEFEHDIVLATSVDSLQTLLQTPNQEFRLILGYSGWGPDQLESELREGVWIPHQSTAESIFSKEPESLWEHQLNDMGLGQGAVWGKAISDA